MHARKRHLISFIAYLHLPQTIHTQPFPNTTYYSALECIAWVNAALSSDLDLSGGLSEDEYFLFLSSVQTPTHVSDYFSNCCNHDGEGIDDGESDLFTAKRRNDDIDLCCTDFSTLPWLLRFARKTLSCRCESLGRGPECCEGESAEMLLDGFDVGAAGRARTYGEAEYLDDFCQQLGFAFKELVPYVPPTDYPGEESPEVEVESRSEVVQPKEDDGGGGMHPGVIFAIIFVILAVIVAGVWYDRKREERKRAARQNLYEAFSSAEMEDGNSPALREDLALKSSGKSSLGRASSHDLDGKTLDASAPQFVVGKDAAEKSMALEGELDTSTETDPDPELQANTPSHQDSDSSSASSVSESGTNEHNEPQPRLPAGSTLAAMGVASTVASRMH